MAWFGLTHVVRLLYGPGPEIDTVGRETVVKTPVKVCPLCAAEAVKSQRREELVRLLERVPLYRQLLKKYPAAHVAIL
jgi:hypothetical protein